MSIGEPTTITPLLGALPCQTSQAWPKGHGVLYRSASWSLPSPPVQTLQVGPAMRSSQHISLYNHPCLVEAFPEMMSTSYTFDQVFRSIHAGL